MTNHDLLLIETGYIACQNDLAEILLDLHTAQNIHVLHEINERLQEIRKVRVLTEFAETQD